MDAADTDTDADDPNPTTQLPEEPAPVGVATATPRRCRFSRLNRSRRNRSLVVLPFLIMGVLLVVAAVADVAFGSVLLRAAMAMGKDVLLFGRFHTTAVPKACDDGIVVALKLNWN